MVSMYSWTFTSTWIPLVGDVQTLQYGELGEAVKFLDIFKDTGVSKALSYIEVSKWLWRPNPQDHIISHGSMLTFCLVQFFEQFKFLHFFQNAKTRSIEPGKPFHFYSNYPKYQIIASTKLSWVPNYQSCQFLYIYVNLYCSEGPSKHSN